MKNIGYHKNIVNMIGCSTIRQPMCLLVEFMEHGDLLNYLRKRRSKVFNLWISVTYQSIVEYILVYPFSVRIEVCLKIDNNMKISFLTLSLDEKAQHVVPFALNCWVTSLSQKGEEDSLVVNTKVFWLLLVSTGVSFLFRNTL